MENVEIKRVRLRVRGLVQGVGYRAATRERATALGLSGWVQNTPDGAVLLDAQGSAAQLEALIEWCRVGPPHARVDGVEVAWGVPGPGPERRPAPGLEPRPETTPETTFIIRR